MIYKQGLISSLRELQKLTTSSLNSRYIKARVAVRTVKERRGVLFAFDR